MGFSGEETKCTQVFPYECTGSRIDTSASGPLAYITITLWSHQPVWLRLRCHNAPREFESFGTCDYLAGALPVQITRRHEPSGTLWPASCEQRLWRLHACAKRLARLVHCVEKELSVYLSFVYIHRFFCRQRFRTHEKILKKGNAI